MTQAADVGALRGGSREHRFALQAPRGLTAIRCLIAAMALLLVLVAVGWLSTQAQADRMFPDTRSARGDRLISGGIHNCAILGNGSVCCWGLANTGQLGYGNTNNVGDDETPGSVGTVLVRRPKASLLERSGKARRGITGEREEER